LNSALRAQVPVDIHKINIHLDIGTPIDNEATRKILKVVDKIHGLHHTMESYNARYGRDSVYAVKFVDREPDEKAEDSLLKNYYNVIVGEDSIGHTSRWFTFLVNKDLRIIHFYDFKKSKTAGIDDWKKIWPASEFLKPESED
jgi:hypothetical protein